MKATPNFRVAFFFFLTCSLGGCSLVATRPVQELSDAAAAIKAAREVQAESRSSEHFRLAEELFVKARQEYRLKNFERAKKAADQARIAAEKAEFLSIRAGAVRNSLSEASPEAAQPAQPAPEASPSPSPDSLNSASPTTQTPPTAP